MRALVARAASAALVLLLGCGSSTAKTSGGTGGVHATGGASGSGGAPSDGGSDAPQGPMPGADATVTAFSKTPVYYTGTDNQREVDAPVSFPATGAYQKIMLHLALECPMGGCDPWDRLASLGVVTSKGQDGGPDTVVEVMRFITPFGVGASWDLDVTDLRPLLTGDLTMRVFIDTWVGPGSQYGAGWLVSATFTMTGGIPAKLPTAVVPVWTRTYVTYGDPSKPIASSVPPATITLPKGSSYALRSFVTGHGQGNLQNCSEFCAKTHTLTAGTTAHTQKVWRTDCATTAAPNQQGTYMYSRSGWCPGADVKPWTVDVTADVGTTGSASFAYDVEAFVNTCRPDAMPCTGCTLGAACTYDGSTHTEPNFQVSTLLIAYQ